MIKKQMRSENLKQIFISICIGAGVAFFSTLFQGLADFFKAHADQIVPAMSASAAYLAKAYRG